MIQLISLTEADCHVYASVKYSIIGSDNVLTPVRRLAINIINAHSTLGNKLQWNFNQNTVIFCSEFAFENAVF